MRLKNILVPIDFSSYSINALKLAKEIADKAEGTVYLLHVIEVPIDKYTFIKDRQKDLIKSIYTSNFIDIVKKNLTKIRDENKSLNFLLNESLRIGDPYNEIVKFVDEENIDMIVIGAKGIMDRQELYLGSLCEKIIRTISCPVITVTKISSENRLKNIVYNADLKLEQLEVISIIKKIQSLFESHINILKINPQEVNQNESKQLDSLRTLALENGLQDFDLDIARYSNEEYGIIEFASQKNADLIAVALHERSGIRRLISGGLLIDEFSDHAFRPILTYHFDIKKDKYVN